MTRPEWKPAMHSSEQPSECYRYKQTEQMLKVDEVLTRVEIHSISIALIIVETL